MDIFLSYRRTDSEGYAGRLFKDLCERFGKDRVLIDVAGMEKGRDFRRTIEQRLDGASVLLAVIGKTWLDVKDSSGRRRLDSASDLVRVETASALKRDIPVVPVLVGGASMPSEAELPEDLKSLAFRDGVELTHARWDTDVQYLFSALEQLLKPPPTAAAAPLTKPQSESQERLAARSAATLALGLRQQPTQEVASWLRWPHPILIAAGVAVIFASSIWMWRSGGVDRSKESTRIVPSNTILDQQTEAQVRADKERLDRVATEQEQAARAKVEADKSAKAKKSADSTSAEKVATQQSAVEANSRIKSTSLRQSERSKLDALARQMVGISLEVIVLVGHTDSSGDETANARVSSERADAVKRYLVDSAGIDETRIHTDSKGSKQPIADNATQAGRIANNRVDLEVVGTKGGEGKVAFGRTIQFGS